MNNPNAYYPRVDFNPEPSVFEFLRKRCTQFADKIAVTDAETGEEWTFTTALSKIVQLREFFKTCGIRIGDRVVVYAFNSLEIYAAVWALASIPAVAILIRPIFKSGEVRTIVELSKCRAVVTDRYHLSTVMSIDRDMKDLLRVVLVEETETPHPAIRALFRKNSSSHLLPESERSNYSEETAFMIPTSGTLGNAKLVEHSHNSFISSFYITAPHVRILHDHDVVLLSSSISHVTGLWAVGGCMHQGIRCIIPRLKEMPPFEVLRDMCDRYKVSTLLTFPTVFRNLLDKATGGPIISVRNLLCGGSRCPSEFDLLLRTWFPNLSHIRQLLGQTEVMVYVSITPENEVDIDTIGHPPSNCEIRIQNVDTGEENRIGEIGELVIRGPCLMKGYFSNPEETRRAFTGDGWLRTGDLGFVHAQKKRFCFVNRIAEVITCRDNRLYPVELERVLAEHPAVGDAAVVGVQDRDLGEAPSALIELREDVEPSEGLRRELSNLIETQFAPYKRLSGGVHFVSALPRTDLNKISRRKLKQLIEELLAQRRSH